MTQYLLPDPSPFASQFDDLQGGAVGEIFASNKLGKSISASILNVKHYYCEGSTFRWKKQSLELCGVQGGKSTKIRQTPTKSSSIKSLYNSIRVFQGRLTQFNTRGTDPAEHLDRLSSHSTIASNKPDFVF